MTELTRVYLVIETRRYEDYRKNKPCHEQISCWDTLPEAIRSANGYQKTAKRGFVNLAGNPEYRVQCKTIDY